MKTVFFKPNMVTSIINGQKVQTRRPVKMQGDKVQPCFYQPRDILSVYEDLGRNGYIPTGYNITVTRVETQSLNEISEGDFSKEGIFLSLDAPKKHMQYTYHGGKNFASAKDAFIALWESIHLQGSPNCWENNPKVWVIEFAVTHVPKISHRLIG